MTMNPAKRYCEHRPRHRRLGERHAGQLGPRAPGHSEGRGKAARQLAVVAMSVGQQQRARRHDMETVRAELAHVGIEPGRRTLGSALPQQLQCGMTVAEQTGFGEAEQLKCTH